MPSKPKNFPPPRKSHTSTPNPSESEALLDRLNFADSPRPFKSPRFTSKLPYRTASTTTTAVRKNVKQILVLERERIGGGDGFLNAELTLARARGEVVEPGGKKKKTGVKLPKGYNLMRGNRRPAAGLAHGAQTPASMEGLESGQSTPGLVGDDLGEGGEGGEGDGAEGDGGEGEGKKEGDKGVLPPGKEVFTYHTPAAPPSLLPIKKYCDITGLHANYTDPRTKLRYKGLDVWHVVRGLGPGGDQAYLSLRGAQLALK